jgi:hypothetical protein
LKAAIDRWQRDADRCEGAERQVMDELSEQFGCKTLKAAEAELKKAERKERQLATEYSEALAKFEAEWEEELD